MRTFLGRVLATLFCLTLAQSAAASPLRVDGSGRLPLAGHLEIIQDPTGKLTLQELRTVRQGDFRPAKGNIARGYGCPTLWLRFTLEAAPGAPPDRLLAVSVPFLQKISLFTPQPDGSFRETAAGAALPQTSQEGRFRRATFPLTLRPVPTTFYLRVVSRTTMVVIPVLWREAPLHDAILWETLFYGGFFGVAIIICLAHLLYWQRVREKVHVHYACYVATTLVLTAANSGHIQFLLTPGAPWIQRLCLDLSTCMILGQGVALFAVTVRLKDVMPRTDRTYRRLAWGISLVSLGISLLGGYLKIAPVLGYCLILMVDLNTVLALRLAWKGERTAKLYLLAFGPVLFSSTTMLASYLSLLPAYPAQELVFSMASIFHVLLMNIPIADHMQRLRRERDTLQAASLRLAETHRRELEDRVSSRTAELRSEKTQVERALEAMNQMAHEQQRLIQTISHEFRTPLAVIDGASQLLSSGVQSSQRITQQIEKIRKGTRRLIHLLDNSLHQDRLTSDGGAFRPRPVALVEVLTPAIAQAQALSDHHRILFTPPPDPVPVLCDPEWLTIALRNLLDNAMKYSPAADTIRVALSLDTPGEVALDITDQGIGIPEEQQDLVFNRYFRGQNVGSIPGVGLGLNLVQQIIHHHQGRLQMMSCVGEGTTIRVILPRFQPQ